jgi:hypothetical protein
MEIQYHGLYSWELKSVANKLRKKGLNLGKMLLDTWKATLPQIINSKSVVLYTNAL